MTTYKYYFVDEMPIKIEINDENLKVASYFYSRILKDFEIDNEYLSKIEDPNKILEVEEVSEEEFNDKIKTIETMDKMADFELQ